jgi:glycerol-3-phosphate dehydrogenase (NAD(P)+)
MAEIQADSQRLLVMGSGAFGQALTQALQRRHGTNVEVFTRRPPGGIDGGPPPFYHYGRIDQVDLARYSTIILALPSRSLPELLPQLSPMIADHANIVSCVKGMDAATYSLPTEHIARYLPGHPVAVMSGPTFASEMLIGNRVWMSLGCANILEGESLVSQLTTPLIALSFTDDVRGLEILGVAKNIIALGAGLTEGLGLGENVRASYIACGIRELARLLPSLGGKAETVLEPGALGDLILTCTSMQSRNYRCGRMLARKNAVQDYQDGKVPLVEGQQSIEAFLDFICRNNIESELFRSLAKAINDPADAGMHLMDSIY